MASQPLDQEKINLLKKVVKESNKSISSFCTDIGINPRTYYNWKNGEPARIELLRAADKKLHELGLLGESETLIERKNIPKAAEKLRIGLLGESETLIEGKNTPEVNNENLNKIILPFKEKIIDMCSKIRVLTMQKPVLTSEVFVDLNIFSNKNKRRLYIDDIAKEIIQVQPNQNFHSLRLIIAASSGSGKTMLMKRLALRCFEYSSTLEVNQQLPIYISLREYGDIESETLEQYIIRKYSIDQKTIKSMSNLGKLLILLDGFDSLESHQRKNIYYAINQFIDVFPKNDYIISCRKESIIFEKFERVELAPLEFEDICELIKKRIKVESPLLTEPQKIDLINHIKCDTELFEIVKNPLLLVLICLIYSERGINHLKLKKWEVVKEVVFVILDKWDVEQGILYETETNFSKTNKEEFLSFIAFQSIYSGKNYLTKETIQDYAIEYINSNSNQLYTTVDIINSFESNHTLLIRLSDYRYEFPRLIFKDYFALRFIRNRFKNLSNFQENEIFKHNPARWTRFMEVAKDAYPILFDDQELRS